MEGDRQVGCGQDQDLKRAKAAVLAMARMVKNLVFFLSFPCIPENLQKLSLCVEHPVQVSLNLGPSV